MDSFRELLTPPISASQCYLVLPHSMQGIIETQYPSKVVASLHLDGRHTTGLMDSLHLPTGSFGFGSDAGLGTNSPHSSLLQPSMAIEESWSGKPALPIQS